jgi:hypothetical protein
VGEDGEIKGVGRHSIPCLGYYLGGLWDGTRFLGRREGIVFDRRTPKKGRFFHSIDGFGIVFGGLDAEGCVRRALGGKTAFFSYR